MPSLDPRVVHLKNGRPVVIRHAAPGDGSGIARLMVAGFPIYRAAARGDAERAAACLAGELPLDQGVVAVLPETGLIAGAEFFSDNTRRRRGRLEAAATKLRLWGWYGLMRFAWASANAAFVGPPVRIAPGEIYKFMAAVDKRYQALGITTQMSDFVQDYAAENGYHSVWSYHASDNLPAMGVQRKRGCTLTPVPLRFLARLLRRPPVLKSSKPAGAQAAGRSSETADS